MISVDEAIENACRLLRAAEVETDRQMMERLERLADSWVSLAGLLNQRENAS